MSWKLSRTVLRGGVTGNGGSLLGSQEEHRKQPYFIKLTDSSPMCFAGIWESWKSPEDSTLETFSILTTRSNALIRPHHDRMPVILRPDDFNFWLSKNMHDTHQLERFYQPLEPDLMSLHKVSDLVNNIRFDNPACIARV
jgi:putative SOS response-associated peptidase YedK